MERRESSRISEEELETVNVEQFELEKVIQHENDAYPLVITESYGPEVINPSIVELRRVLNGEHDDWVNKDSKTALVPMQANGRCMANCKGCVFAAKVTEDIVRHGDVPISKVIARPVKPDAMKAILDDTYAEVGQPFRVGAVLSGDPAFNPHSLEVIQSVIDNPNVIASRWSTIAVSTKVDVLSKFEQAAQYLADNPENTHRAHFQVSLHSTDPKKREEYVNYHSDNSYLTPIPMEDIANTFRKIYRLTGKPSTLAFIVDNEDIEIDTKALREHFDPEYTWVSLRPRIPTLEYDVDVDPEKLVEAYSKLRDDGWSVMVVPPTKTNSEQRNMVIGRK